MDRQHIIGHYEVANNRSDPGTLDIDAIVAELQTQEEGFLMALTDEEQADLKNKIDDLYDAFIGWKVAAGDTKDGKYVGASTRDEMVARIRNIDSGD